MEKTELMEKLKHPFGSIARTGRGGRIANVEVWVAETPANRQQSNRKFRNEKLGWPYAVLICRSHCERQASRSNHRVCILTSICSAEIQGQNRDLCFRLGATIRFTHEIEKSEIPAALALVSTVIIKKHSLIRNFSASVLELRGSAYR